MESRVCVCVCVPIIERSRAVSRDFCPPENLRRHDRFGRPLAPLAAPRLAGGCRRVRSSLPAGLSGGLRCEPAASLPRRRVLRASSESPVSQPPQPYLPVHTLPGARTDPAASRTRLSHASEMQSDSDSGHPAFCCPWAECTVARRRWSAARAFSLCRRAGLRLWRAVRSSSLAPVPSLAHVPLKPRCGASRWAHTPHSHTFPALGPAQAHSTVRRDRAGNAPLALVSAHGRRAASRRQTHQSRAATDSATPLHHVREESCVA